MNNATCLNNILVYSSKIIRRKTFSNKKFGNNL